MTDDRVVDKGNRNLGPEGDWEEVDPSRLIGPTHSFVSGEPEGERLRIRYYRDRKTGDLVAKAWFGPKAEGPPGYAHGGSIAAVLDEAMGYAAWASGCAVVAGRLTVDFRKPLPLDSVVRVDTVFLQRRGKKIILAGKIVDSENQVLASGEGIYIEIEPKSFRKDG